jgi:hypothetical protein
VSEDEVSILFQCFLFGFRLFGLLTKICRKENATGASFARASVREASAGGASVWGATVVDSVKTCSVLFLWLFSHLISFVYLFLIQF